MSIYAGAAPSPLAASERNLGSPTSAAFLHSSPLLDFSGSSNPSSSSPLRMLNNARASVLNAAQMKTNAPSDMVHVVKLFEAYREKRYKRGFLWRRNDLNADGKPVVAREWQQCWTELVGPVMTLWPTEHPANGEIQDWNQVEDQDLDGDLEKELAAIKSAAQPSYINISDSTVELIGYIPNDDDGPRDCVFSLNSAGSNRFLLQAPDSATMNQWACAIRLSAFEKGRLQEIYTSALLKRPVYRSLAEKYHSKFKGYVQARFGGTVDWHRYWVEVHDHREGERKRKGFETRGQCAFYETKKSKTPVMTLVDTHQAYAVYPEKPQLVDVSTVAKVEGMQYLGKASEDKGAAPCSVLLMASSTQELGEILYTLFDAFKLYGRPHQLLESTYDPASLCFARPYFFEQYARLFLTLDQVQHTRMHGITPLEVKQTFDGILRQQVESARPPPVAPVRQTMIASQVKQEDVHEQNGPIPRHNSVPILNSVNLKNPFARTRAQSSVVATPLPSDSHETKSIAPSTKSTSELPRRRIVSRLLSSAPLSPASSAGPRHPRQSQHGPIQNRRGAVEASDSEGQDEDEDESSDDEPLGVSARISHLGSNPATSSQEKSTCMGDRSALPTQTGAKMHALELPELPSLDPLSFSESPLGSLSSFGNGTSPSPTNSAPLTNAKAIDGPEKKHIGPPSAPEDPPIVENKRWRPQFTRTERRHTSAAIPIHPIFPAREDAVEEKPPGESVEMQWNSSSGSTLDSAIGSASSSLVQTPPNGPAGTEDESSIKDKRGAKFASVESGEDAKPEGRRAENRMSRKPPIVSSSSGESSSSSDATRKSARSSALPSMTRSQRTRSRQLTSSASAYGDSEPPSRPRAVSSGILPSQVGMGPMPSSAASVDMRRSTISGRFGNDDSMSAYGAETSARYRQSAMMGGGGPMSPALYRYSTQPPKGSGSGAEEERLSAREQIEIARALGQPFVQLPNKVPEPQHGLVGHIHQRERERKTSSTGRRASALPPMQAGIGMMEEQERERRALLEQQAMLQEQWMMLQNRLMMQQNMGMMGAYGMGMNMMGGMGYGMGMLPNMGVPGMVPGYLPYGPGFGPMGGAGMGSYPQHGAVYGSVVGGGPGGGHPMAQGSDEEDDRPLGLSVKHASK
ncbi:uncharacterized protein VTP21DRAFT_3594 [Calcarisporiella thermophila]|uniref:uncharacterized protein n=1 Tax=Calcarisporiella thermophila TaxID=911321 RepID=UPI00374282EF